MQNQWGYICQRLQEITSEKKKWGSIQLEPHVAVIHSGVVDCIKGLQFRFIMQQELAKTVKIAPEVEHLKERRCLERICVASLITEKESVVNFRRRDGEMDYVGFFGKDERFRKWTRNLFMYYWDRAERWFRSTRRP